MRKVDLWLIPWLCLLYLLSFLDRTNIGNARAAGLEADIDMVGRHRYNHSLTIFFISYALAEPVTNVLLKRLSPRVFFTGIIIAWGTIMTLMGLVENFAGLMVARFFLGLTEAGLYPGVNYYLSCWYKRDELGVSRSKYGRHRARVSNGFFHKLLFQSHAYIVLVASSNVLLCRRASRLFRRTAGRCYRSDGWSRRQEWLGLDCQCRYQSISHCTNKS